DGAGTCRAPRSSIAGWSGTHPTERDESRWAARHGGGAKSPPCPAGVDRLKRSAPGEARAKPQQPPRWAQREKWHAGNRNASTEARRISTYRLGRLRQGRCGGSPAEYGGGTRYRPPTGEDGRDQAYDPPRPGPR